MNDENSLTHRGKQYEQALDAIEARYNALPDSLVRHALLDAVARAAAALAKDAKYRRRDLPDLPQTDPSFAIWAKVKARDSQLPPSQHKTIGLIKSNDRNPLQPSNSQPKKPTIGIEVRKGVPRQSARRGKP